PEQRGAPRRRHGDHDRAGHLPGGRGGSAHRGPGGPRRGGRRGALAHPQGTEDRGIGRSRVAITTNDLKNGYVLDIDGDLVSVVSFQHVKPGKGGAFVRTKLKNMASGAVVERTFRAGEKVERVTTETRTMEFLYRDGDQLFLMDKTSYEQIAIDAAAVDSVDLLAPNTDVQVLFVRERAFRAELPTFVELAVVRTDPGVKGDTVSNVTKP
ncbi:MAG: elongation factor P, partial [Pseudonocardiaceae bacterium]|nr:elongation factor P [Pseudonocardiaceae bacterium]